VLVSKLKAIEAQMAVMRAQTGQVDQETLGRYMSETNRLSAAEAEAASLEAQLKQAQEDYKRLQTLGMYSSGQELDHARSALQQAQERHRKALSEIAAARGTLSSVGGSRQQVNVITQQLLVLIRQAEEMQAEIRRREVDIADRTINAPTGGKVVMTFVRKGEHVAPGQRILMFHDPAHIWVQANVRETDVGRLKVGMTADVYADAYPGKRIKAEVFRIGEAATNRFALLPDPNPSGNFTKITQRLPLRLKLIDRDAALRPGMMVEVYVATGNH
jgi:membrane fusion protein (multidrug efflux system)